MEISNERITRLINDFEYRVNSQIIDLRVEVPIRFEILDIISREVNLLIDRITNE